MSVCSSLFLDYCILGGMPAVVREFIAKGTFEGSLEVQRQLIADYKEDIRKYAEGIDQTRIVNVFNHIPAQLAKDNKKFQISKVASGARFRDYRGCVEWLDDAGMVNVCYCLNFPELPLQGNYDDTKYKIYFADSGLLVAMLDEEAQEDLRTNKNLGVYKGALYENVVGEALVKAGYKLYYYKRDDSSLEQDFFVRTASALIPVEVKAKNGTAKSMRTLISSEKYADIHCGIKFTGGNIGYSDDTPENTIEHFFGGIVAVEKRIPGSNRQQRELIDGQQRITTTLLLIIALIRKYEKLKDVSNGTLIDNRINKLRQKYLRYDDEINREPITVQKLVLSKADKQYFEDLIEARECTERRDSHRRINRAFKKLEKFVAGIIDAEATVDAKIDALAKIENIVHNNCTIIFIDSKTRESAYKLFQVLNDRGAGLTEGDLLKSKTLEVLEKHFSIKQSTVQDAWDEILQDEPKQIEQFLRYYYASACGSRVGRTSLYDDFLKQFFPDIVDVDDVSDEATATKIVDTVNQILREIRTYRKLIAGIWPYEVGQPLTDWDRKRLDILIRFLDFDIVYPLLLAAVQLKQKTFADLVHMLEKFLFRHKSVCNLGHQKLSELYMQEAVKIRRDPENYRLTGLRTTLKEYIETECTDAVFKVGLSNLKYRTNGGNKPLRYLFSTLNEHIEWYRNGAVGAPAPQKGTVINYDNVTIEHIASQSPSAAVPGFTSENIHTLSNLTLLTNGENDRAKNKSYTAKKAIYHDSEYVINKYFDSVDDWSVESAKAWEQYLQEMVCKVFVV